MRAALKPGGTLVLDAPMTGKKASEWTAMVSLLLRVNGGSGTHSFEQYRAWLEDAGVGQVRPLNERWLATVKAT